MTATLPPIVLSWSRGLASLSPGVVPCQGLRDEEWRETHRRCCEFVDRWGVQAHKAGWDTLRLFGVGPDTGALRGDFCGIMIPSIADMHEVTPEWVKVGVWTNYRHEPMKMPGMVPLWEFGEGAGWAPWRVIQPAGDSPIFGGASLIPTAASSRL